jgi:hypothetical protein
VLALLNRNILDRIERAIVEELEFRTLHKQKVKTHFRRSLLDF